MLKKYWMNKSFEFFFFYNKKTNQKKQNSTYSLYYWKKMEIKVTNMIYKTLKRISKRLFSYNMRLIRKDPHILRKFY